jgi:very-short-patch-repair endonuclease
LIEAQGFLVLRFWDNQVFRETQAVVDEIARVVAERKSVGIPIEKEHRAEPGDRPA